VNAQRTLVESSAPAGGWQGSRSYS
jgi:hypothetical protein